MSGATATSAQGTDADAGDSGLTEPGERGSLTVADRVVARIAGHAVTLSEQAMAAPRRVLGVNVGEPRPDERAQVSAHVDGAAASINATIAVRWPASVTAVTADVRRHIRAEVNRMTDLEVDHVDIEVADMSVITRPAPRVR